MDIYTRFSRLYPYENALTIYINTTLDSNGRERLYLYMQDGSVYEFDGESDELYLTSETWDASAYKGVKDINEKKKLFSEKLKNKMEEKGMCQADIVSKTGLPKNTVSQYINGKRFPKHGDALQALANALDCDINDLV